MPIRNSGTFHFLPYATPEVNILQSIVFSAYESCTDIKFFFKKKNNFLKARKGFSAIHLIFLFFIQAVPSRDCEDQFSSILFYVSDVSTIISRNRYISRTQQDFSSKIITLLPGKTSQSIFNFPSSPEKKASPPYHW